MKHLASKALFKYRYFKSMLQYKYSGLRSRKSSSPWGLLEMPRSIQRAPTEYHNEVCRLISEIKPRGICVDAGAWVGDITLLLSTTASKVIALEPDPNNLRFLMLNMKFNSRKNIQAMQYALDTKDGIADLITAKSSAGHSLYAWKGFYHYPVQTISIETLLKDIPEVDLFHMDIQKAESHILFSAPDYIFDKVKRWIVECHAEGLDKLDVELELEFTFYTHGYQTQWLEPPAEKDSGRHIYATK